MKKNSFKFDSGLDKFEKDLTKAEAKHRNSAVKVFTDAVKSNIKALGLVKDGDLLKGVSTSSGKHTTLAGMGPPAFHANIIEYGTVERFTKGKGPERSGVRSTGTVTAKPFFLPAFRIALPQMQAIMEEEWL